MDKNDSELFVDLRKLGEFYGNRKTGQYVFVCYHCGKHFDSFTEIDGHIAEENQEIAEITDLKIDDEVRCIKLEPHPQVEEILFDLSSCEVKEENDVDIKDDCLISAAVVESMEDIVSENITFTCDICNKTFKTKLKIAEHMIRSHNRPDKEYRCNICPMDASKVYSKRGSFRKHMSLYHRNEFKKMILQKCNNNATVNCEICNKILIVGSISAREHMETHQNLHTYKCTECDGGYNTHTQLRIHLRRIHKIRENLEEMSKCEICDKVLDAGLNATKEHMEIHENLKAYKCDKCDKCFNTQTHLRKHLRRHRAREKRDSVKCEICKKTLSAGHNAAKEHMEMHANLQLYKCPICAKGYNTQTYLRKHIKRGHDDEVAGASVKCEMCDKYLMAGSQVAKEHMETHYNLQSHKCTQCEKTFNTNTHLRRHVKRSHTECARKYVCEVCSKSFREDRLLKIHIRIHTGEKNYKCEICNKAFSQSGYLKIHRRGHTGEKPYQCYICGVSFDSTAKLNHHTKFKHTKLEKTFACTICDRKFMTEYLRDKHEKNHSLAGLRPFQCEVCKKFFASKKVLRNHELLHGSDKRFKCKFCDMTFAQSAGRRGHEKNKHLNV